LIEEIRGYHNTILMSDMGGVGDQGFISGLNGLLLGVARERNIEAVCLMGEIPYYLQGAPWPYPKASISVIEVIASILDMKIELKHLEQLAKKIEQNIDDFLHSLYEAKGVPDELKQQIEGLRHKKQAGLGPITEEEQKKIVEHIDELFRGEEGSGRRYI
jgi:proteasome assembly chaperone (PAC2) family protein